MASVAENLACRILRTPAQGVEANIHGSGHAELWQRRSQAGVEDQIRGSNGVIIVPQELESDTAVNKQRRSKGQLSEKETQEIVDLFRAGSSAVDIAAAYNTTASAVYGVTRDAGAINGARPARYVTGTQIYAIIEDQKFKCNLSGDELTMQNAEADHITPLTRGGSMFIENLQIVTTTINRAKGQMTNEEFVLMCCKVADHSRSQLPE